MDCWMCSFLQNSLKVSEVKLVAASEIVFHGSSNLANVILAVCTRSFADRLATISTSENLL